MGRKLPPLQTYHCLFKVFVHPVHQEPHIYHLTTPYLVKKNEAQEISVLCLRLQSWKVIDSLLELIILKALWSRIQESSFLKEKALCWFRRRASECSLGLGEGLHLSSAGGQEQSIPLWRLTWWVVQRGEEGWGSVLGHWR